ncbi:MAG: hypothetical protein D6796_00600 [Caldilineae bacterium]|nr:MAG: hypothetical protein D6796_00600 [Caldilineae bacterium]
MKRKVYHTALEQRQDQYIGAIAFVVVNVVVVPLVLAIGTHSSASFAATRQYWPWIINAFILGLALLFRPHLALGYVAAIVLLIGAALTLGTIVMTACFIALPVAALVVPLSPLVICILVPLLVAGALFGGWQLFGEKFQQWWQGE